MPDANAMRCSAGSNCKDRAILCQQTGLQGMCEGKNTGQVDRRVILRKTTIVGVNSIAVRKGAFTAL